MSAACTNHPTIDWFSPADYPAAAAICATCDERAGCEAGARARGEQHGMWGTWIADEVTMLDGWPIQPAAEVVHGKRGTGCTCARCKKAHADYVAAWRERGRMSQVAEAGPEQLTFDVGATA